MNTSFILRVTLTLVVGVALAGGGYLVGIRRTMSSTSAVSSTHASGEDTDVKPGRKVLYWHDPMAPKQHFDKPGKSPFMDMQLQPVYADESGSDGISVDGGLQQRLGIRYAVVRRQDVVPTYDVIGTTEFDESKVDVIESRTVGYIDHLYASAPQQRIQKGAPIASIFVPEWLAPQEEYLALKAGRMDHDMLAAARVRMRALSIPADLVAALDRSGKVQTHVTLFAPESGVLTELNLRNGAMVSPGQAIAKVTSLSTLWLIVDIPESLALQVQPGMRVDAAMASDMSRSFSSLIREVLPAISPSSRTLQARVAIDNAALNLTAGMLMRVRISAATPVARLLVPSEAIITTGKQSIVIVKDVDGSLHPTAISTGRDTGELTEVTNGLTAGQEVVASGQFLIDSEASLKSVLPRLAAPVVSGLDTSAINVPPDTASLAPATYETTGKVEQVTATDITLSHQAVPALGWGAMTMAFGKPSPSSFPGVRIGQTVRFTFRSADAGYQLTQIDSTGDAK